MSSNPKKPKQLTLDSLPLAQKQESTKSAAGAKEKQIIITGIAASTKETELTLKVSLKLVPSKISFAKVHSDLWFDDQPIKSVALRVLKGPLATDESEYAAVLDMTGIPAGTHKVKVEMYELWSPDEKFCRTFKEVTLDYLPQTRESRFVKVPNVKSFACRDLEFVFESEKEVYRDIEITMKKEQLRERDDW